MKARRREVRKGGKDNLTTIHEQATDRLRRRQGSKHTSRWGGKHGGEGVRVQTFSLSLSEYCSTVAPFLPYPFPAGEGAASLGMILRLFVFEKNDTTSNFQMTNSILW